MFQERLESFLDAFDLFLFLLLEFLVDGGHIFGDSLLLEFLQSSKSLQVLLLSHFSSEDVSHDVLFVLLQSVQRFAKLKNGHCAVLVTDCCVLSSNDLVAAAHVANFDAGERRI